MNTIDSASASEITPADSKPSFSISKYIATFFTIVAIIGLFMTLAGYGIALSVDLHPKLTHV